MLPLFHIVFMLLTINCGSVVSICSSGCKCSWIGYCYGCKDGYYQNDKKLCEICSANCSTCSSNRTCTECKAGFYLKPFDNDKNICHPCAEGCSVCSSKYECNHCNTGYFRNGGSCRKCPKSCTKCSSENECLECNDSYHKNGTLCLACPSGFFWQESACLHCLDNCASCTMHSECTECKPGYFGLTCTQRCSPGCIDEVCEQETANCSCQDNFIGESCGTCTPTKFGPACNQDCPKRCWTCDSYENCTMCIAGYYGERCEKKCSGGCLESHCNPINGSCDKCKPSYYGQRCEMTCPSGCLDDVCNRESGVCDKCKPLFKRPNCINCMDGYWGKDCSRDCPNSCRSCLSSTVCTKCKDGFHGENCEKKCSYGCLSDLCDQYTGVCYESCKADFTGTYCKQCIPGMYGGNCSVSCPENCYNGTCDTRDGTCLLGCIPKFHGRYCNFSCPDGCSDGMCRSNGHCDACIPGYYGEYCNISCSNNCINSSCNIAGYCNDCQPGYFGMFCSENCSEHCLSGECLRNGSCYPCQSGFYGTKCNRPCRKNCQYCADSWSCKSCFNGFYGKICQDKCSYCKRGTACDIDTGYCKFCEDGFYGNKCKSKCDSKCQTCVSSGSCNNGCLEGFEGAFCSQETTIENTSSTTKQIGSVILLVSVVTLTISVVVVAVILLKKRQKPKRERVVSERFGDVVTYRQVRSVCDRSKDMSLGIVSIKRNNQQKQRLSGNKKHNAACPESPASNDDNHPTHCLSESTAEYATIRKKHPDTMFQEGAAECSETFDDHIYFNADEVMKRKIPLDQLREFVQNKTMDNYVEEFKELPSGLIKPHKASQKRENILKNRYRDIYPYDSKRVILREGKSDYINASYIDGYMKQRAYIASMGPTIKQMGADFDVFWNMVWQERVGKIVMLTNLRESGLQKCDKYWPDEGCCNKYGNVKVMCQVEEIYANYTARIFTMEKTEKRTLYQMHFTAWPDKRTPQQVSSLTDFWEKVKGISTTEDGPMIVHCSAGVGRTGTYIALDILANEGMSEGHVDIFACVRNLREERVCLVQTVGQYRFLHEALLQILSPDNTHV